MTLALVSPYSSFESSNIGFIPPISDESLKLWHFFGSKSGALGKNLAMGGGDSMIVGSPVVSERYVSLVGAKDYLQSAVTQPASFTQFAVARSPQTNPNNLPYVPHPFVLSTYRAPRAGDPNVPSIGASIYFNQPPSAAGNANGAVSGVAGSWSGVAGSDGTAVGGTSLHVDTTVWHMYAFIKDGRNRIFYNLTDNTVQVTAAPADQQDDLSTQTFRIGSAYSDESAPIDLAHVSMYYRAFTVDEVSTMAAYLRKFYAKRGIAI